MSDCLLTRRIDSMFFLPSRLFDRVQHLDRPLTALKQRTKTLFEQSMISPPSAMRFSYPLPCGAILHDNGVQFVVISR
ncbi:MAG: hypothetical protein LBI05_11355, partial [Planctomycetaceae bacterium]|nr:hypothetical protein [Planctomycetaceae bacterium]